MKWLAILAVLVFVGCDTNPPATQPAQRAAPGVKSDYARFLPYPQATGLALDTKTGLLCHTFNEKADTYIPTGKSQTLGVVIGKPIEMGHWELDSAPLCFDLSQNEAKTLKGLSDLNQRANDLYGTDKTK